MPTSVHHCGANRKTRIEWFLLDHRIGVMEKHTAEFKAKAALEAFG